MGFALATSFGAYLYCRRSNRNEPDYESDAELEDVPRPRRVRSRDILNKASEGVIEANESDSEFQAPPPATSERYAADNIAFELGSDSEVVQGDVARECDVSVHVSRSPDIDSQLSADAEAFVATDDVQPVASGIVGVENPGSGVRCGDVEAGGGRSDLGSLCESKESENDGAQSAAASSVVISRCKSW